MIDLTAELLLLHAKAMVQSPHFQIFFWLVVFDVITGYAKAGKYRNLDSHIGGNGLVKHGLIVAFVAVFGVYARALGYRWVGIAFVSSFIANYGISLIENADALGIEMPEWFAQYFARMRHKYSKRLEKSKIKDDLKIGKKDDEE